MVEPIRYLSTNTNHTFDFNYQKASLLTLLDALKKNDSRSAKLKKILIEKAQQTLGLNRLPDSDRVTPFFHCQEGEFHITFLYDSAATSTPWNIIVANNFGELIPLFIEIYDLLKRPIFDSSSATIGNFSVFHHQNAIGYHTNGSPTHRYLEYNNHQKEHADETGDETSILEMNNRNSLIDKTAHQKRIRDSTRQQQKTAEMSDRLVAFKKSTSTTKKGRKNSVFTESIQMSSSMPNLDNSRMIHPYATRHRKSNNSLLHK